MAEPAQLSPEQLEALRSLMGPEPENFRMVAQIYADQGSLVRRSMNAALIVLSANESSGSVLFDFSGDSLKGLELNDAIVEIHTRIIDLLVMTAFGQKIEISEFQDYAKTLVPYYATFDFMARLKTTALKNPALEALEQEWASGTDFKRVQAFFKVATQSVGQAAAYCNINIAELPEF